MSIASDDHKTDLPAILAELLKRSKYEQRSMRRFFWVVLVVFCTAVIAISVLSVIAPRFSDATKSEGDFLRVAVPVIVVAIGFGVTFLGLKRLEQFDNELNLVRAGLMTQLTEERKLAAEDRKQLQIQLDVRVRDVSTDIKNRAEGLVAEAIKVRHNSLVERVDKFKQDIEERIQHTTKSLEPYLWLKKYESELDTVSSVETAGLAHSAASKFAAANEPDMAFRIMRTVVERNITGESDDFHNLGVVAARFDHYLLAAQITDAGLKVFPTNVDLLADGLCYHAKYGNLARCHDLRQALEKIPREQWNWRAFSFLADYFFEAGQVDDALKVYADYQRVLPTEDKAYSTLGQYYSLLGQHEKAIEILTTATKRTRRCAQSAAMLCETHLRLAQYQQAIVAADMALEGAAEMQPSANIAAVVMNRALAYDGLLSQRLGEMGTTIDIGEVVRLARQCAENYQLATKLTGGRRENIVAAAPNRLALLRSLLGRIGIPSQTVDEVVPDNQSEGRNDLIEGILSQMARQNSGGHTFPPSDGIAQ